MLVDSPYFPVTIKYIWDWYLDLSGTRNTVMGLSAITYVEITAWAGLKLTEPSPWEVELIMRLDKEFRQYRETHTQKAGK